jgi:Ca-activated chloride channel family protein
MAAMAAAQMIPYVQQEQKSDPFRISVQSQLVEVFLTVTKGNQWIPNLKVSEFRLTEDGIPVPVLRIDNQDVPLQIVLLFDVSESIRDSLNTIQDAAAAFVESLNPEDRVTLVLFGSEITAYPQTTDDREPILRAIGNARAGGVTRLNDAILLGMNLLKDRLGRKAIVCFTDGQDTSGTTSRQEVRNAAAQSGFPIYTLGTGAGLELASLKMILRDFAEISGGKAFFIQNLRSLREVFIEVAAELRSAYVLHYYTQVAPDGGWHELKVETIDPKYSVHARKGFFAGAAAK